MIVDLCADVWGCPIDRPEAHGTCWHECRCDASYNCAYSENECANFTCESALWRRKGTTNACVQDKCKQVLSPLACLPFEIPLLLKSP